MADQNKYQLRELASSIATLQSGKYSDFMIRCSDNTVIRAHRAVICPRSRVLSAAVDGKFQEAISNEVYLGDDEPEIVKNMVEFLYTTDFNDRRSSNKGNLEREADGPPALQNIFGVALAVPDPLEEYKVADASQEITAENSPVNTLEYNPHSLTINAKMYIIADKNGVEALKKLASTKYEQVVLRCWNNYAFAESAKLVYENTLETDRALRDVIAQTAADNIKALLDRGEFIGLLNSCGELATDILKRVVVSGQPANGFDFAPSSVWETSAFSRGKKKKGNPF